MYFDYHLEIGMDTFTTFILVIFRYFITDIFYLKYIQREMNQNFFQKVVCVIK